MPTYQYACTTCGHQLEAVQSFTAEPLTECPSCAGRLRKVFNSVGIVFKGSGFYRTDSRSNGTDAPAAAKSTSGTADSSSTKSESKSSTASGDSGSNGSGNGGGSAAKPAAASSSSSSSSSSSAA